MKFNLEANDTIIDVPGVLAGHVTDLEAATGCTVLLCEGGAVGGVDQRGGAPATHETDLLRPGRLVQEVHGICLSGGSAYGLAASAGVMRLLEERGVGFPAGPGKVKVPIVPGASLFDLALGRADVRPDADMGYAAAKNALESRELTRSNGGLPQGNVGAGTGASAGKMLGPKKAVKTGLGSACLDVGGGIYVGAVLALNCFGDILDPVGGEILAGTRKLRGPGYADTLALMSSFWGRRALRFVSGSNTVIGVVATNAALTKEGAGKVASMAQNGLGRMICPAHTSFDGDTLFTLSTGTKKAAVTLIGAMAAEAVAQAILRAVDRADSLHGIPCGRELAETWNSQR